MINPNINISRTVSVANKSFSKADFSEQEYELFLKELPKIAIKLTGRTKNIVSQILNHIASGTTYLVKPDPDLAASKKLFEDSRGRLKLLVNQIRKQVPTLDIIDIMKNNIPDTSLNDQDFINALFQEIEKQLKVAIQPFQNFFIDKYKLALSKIASDFGIQNAATALQNAIGEFASNLTGFDPAIKAFSFATNILDKSKKTRYPGVSGLYAQQDFEIAMDKELQEAKNYKTNPLNHFAAFAIDNIVKVYKKLINAGLNMPTTAILKDINALRKEKSQDADLNKLEKVFPGLKAIVEKLQKHTDGNLYGKFIYVDKNPANILNSSIGVNYEYKGKIWELISPQFVQIRDIKSPVQTAKLILLGALKSIDKKEIKFTEGNFIQAIQSITNPTDFNNAYKGLNDISITSDELVNLIKTVNSSMSVKLKNAFDQMKKAAPKADNSIKIKLHPKAKRLEVNVKFTDNTLLAPPDPTNKDEVDSVKVSNSSNLFNATNLDLKVSSYMDLLNSKISSIEHLKIPWYNLRNYVKGTNDILGNWFIEDNPAWLDIKNLIAKWENDFQISPSRFTFVHKYNKVSSRDEIEVTDTALSNSKFKTYIFVDTEGKNFVEKDIVQLIKSFHGKKGSILDSNNLDKSNGLSKLTLDQMDQNLTNHNNASFKNIVEKIEKSWGYKIDWGDIVKIPYDSIDNSIKNKWGIVFTFSYNNLDAFATTKPLGTSDIKDPNFKLFRSIAYRSASLKERNKALIDLQKFAKNQKTAISKVPLQTRDKKTLIENAKKSIDKTVDQFELDISINQNPELSKTELALLYTEAENKIKLERLKIEKSVSMKDLIKRISEIFGGNIPPSLISSIQDHPDVFLSLIDKTHNKDIIKAIAENKALLENLDTLLDMPGFDQTLNAIIKSYKNYSYAYFGTGIAAGIIGLGAGGASVAALKANAKINKLKNKKINIKGNKMIVWITSIISLGSIATSIALLIWFFVNQGGF